MFAELSLLDSGLTAHTIGDTVAELMGTVARDNLHNLWQAAQNKFTHAHPLSQHALGQQVHHPPRYGSRPQESVSFSLLSSSSLFIISLFS